MSVLFEHVTAVTMDKERRILKDAYVAVEGTKIASVGTQRPQGAFDRVIDGAGKVLMPGFVKRCVISGVVSIFPISIKRSISAQSQPSTPPVLKIRFFPYISGKGRI